MTKLADRPGITQLSFQRTWLLAKLDHGGLSKEEDVDLMDGLEELDFKIAATPCISMQDLCLKIERLADLLYPADTQIPEDCLEHILLWAVLRDARRLAGAERAI